MTHASMNRAYTLVWNDKQQAYVAAPETARRRGKCTVTVIAAAVATLFHGGVAHALDPGALPGGGVVTAGQAAIGQSGKVMTIQQSSGKAAIDWRSFNIGSDAQVKFVQPSASAVALNRVVGQDASQILGALQANGQIFILNPNGVLFAPGAQVSAAGVLASTRGMGNDDFMAGKLNLSGSGAGKVVNEGSITAASGGYVVLVGAQVRNSGAIAAPQGDVRLAAANQVSLQIAGAGLTAFSVDQGTLDALADNHGLIKADGGRIFLTADALDQLAKAMVNNTGVIEAHTVENHNGTIVLKGDMRHGTVQVGGTLDASAPGGGDGGFIETSAAHVQFSPTHLITAQSASGKTGNWLIDPTDFTIAASGGDITGTQLSSNLGGVNVTIQSTSGAQGTAGNINVNDVVTWSANKLTLNAQNNINLNANMNGSGTASLALEYGQSAVASGNTSRYTLASGVKVALPAGNNFSTKLGSNGSTNSFYVITALGAEGSSTKTDLQGMRAGVTGNYALGADIDASATSTWQSGQGFTFIGTQGNVFTGNVEGLGHTIDSLNQNWAVGYVGFVGKLGSTGRVGNLNLTNVNIRGGLDNVGGLVGYNDKGSIEHVSVQGKISGGNNATGGVVGFNDGTVTDAHANNVMVTGKNYGTGGLIGKQSTNGTTTLSDSSGTIVGFYDVGGLMGSSSTDLNGLHSSAVVNPTGGESGGLVGRANGKISNSYATGNITAPSGDLVGGLVGQADGAISNSYATGNVSAGGGYTGGLAGKANGAVSDSYAAGTVNGAHIVGGLVGYQKADASISNSHATGNVTGTLYSIGGLAGLMGGSVTNSYATGDVRSATDAVGGLVGSWSSGVSPEIKDSYATGAVSGRYAVGGLVGDMSACFCFVKNSHATGKITATADYVGGLIGYVDLGEISDSWASGDVSGINNVGGMAGQGVNISNSFATGKVSGQTNIGGLVGLEKMGGTVTGASYSTGNVTGTVVAAGGLVGRNEGTVTGASYTTSLVVGVTSAGGLIGENYGAVSNAQTGHNGTSGPVVTGGTGTGGLIGYNNGSVATTVATGAVSGSSDYTGGLIGFNDTSGAITGSKASGTVSGKVAVGGMIGENDGSIQTSYFDTGTVSGTSQVGGLVGFNAATGSIGNASYTKQAVTATGNEVGGLVGQNRGTVGGSSYANGVVSGVDRVGGLIGYNKGGKLDTVTAGVGSVSGHDQVGGLIGLLEGGTVTKSSATGAVTGNSQIGGFVGRTTSSKATVTSNSASGAVSATSSAGGFVGYNETSLSGNSTNGNSTTSIVTVSSGQAGGFAGINASMLSDISNTNNITITTAVQDVGGIVGVNLSGGTLQTSHPGNTVLANKATNVGGAVGRNDAGATITTTYAANNVTGLDATGGLVGVNNGTVSIAYASGNVTGHDNVGGLIGKQGSSGSATNVYATSTTSGNAHVGGLTGYGGGTVSYSYASGSVSGSSKVGGLLGSTNGAAVTSSVFSLSGTGQSHSTSDFASAEVAAGKTALEMQSAATYTGWDLATTGAHNKTWRSYDGLAAPLLTYWLTPITASATGSGDSFVYDGTVHNGTVSAVSYTGSPNMSLLLGAPTLSGRNVGVYTPGSGVYSVQQGYDITFTGTGTLTITPAPLSGTVTATRTYDGSTVASAGVGQVVLSGFIGGDSATSKAVTGSYNSKDVASASTVTFALSAADFTAGSGTLLSNYSVPATITGTGTITRAPLSATLSPVTKVYDGTTGVTLNPASFTLSGFATGESATANISSGTFNSKDVMNATSVTATLSGATAVGATNLNNYTLPTVASGAGTITPKTVTATIVNADKVYDGGVSASSTLNVVGLVPGDQVVLAGSGSFSDKNAGVGKTVNITSITYDTVAANNYTIAVPVTGTATISPKSLTVTASASDKVYDGSTSATIALSSAGVINGDTVSFSGNGSFGDKNVATAKPVSVTGIASSGADSGNYAITNNTASAQASITPKPLNVSATSAGKVYDGNTSANVVLSSTGMINGDQLVLSGTGAYSDKNVGTGKTVTVSGIVLGGTDGANYSLGNAVSTTAAITKLGVNVTASGNDKVYDGLAGATVGLQAGGLIQGDQLTLSGNASFTDKNVGQGKAVAVAGIAAAGADAGNYQLLNTSTGTTANITARPVTISATAADKVYDGNTSAAVQLSASGVINGDQLVLSGTGAFSDKHAATGKTVTVSSITLGGNDGGNYSFSNPVSTTAAITKLGVNITASGIDKVYDGTADATATLLAPGMIQGDQLTLRGSASFNDKNAGQGKAVAVTSITSAGADAGNYQLLNTSANTTANISAKNLNVVATASDRVYDGGTSATITLSSSDIVAGDDVKFTGNGSFADKKVGTAKTVSITGVDSRGLDSSNYIISKFNASTQASITPLALTVAATSSDKVYDGNTSAKVVLNAAGVLAGDAVALSGTGAFSDKNAGIGKAVTVTGIVLGGTDGANYSVGNTVGTTAAITPRAVSVTASGVDKIYDGNTDAAVTLQAGGVLQGDQLSLTGNATFNDKNAGRNKAVTVAAIAGTGADAANYQLLGTSASTTANITARPLTISASASDKVYDGSTGAQVQLSAPGAVSGDQLVLSGTGTFSDKNAATGKTVTVSGVVVGGKDGGNYSVGNAVSTTAAITPLGVNVTASGIDKVYDGKTDATVTLQASGVLQGDQLTLGGNASFSDKNAGQGKTVTVAAITGAGADAGNYRILNNSASSTASIRPKSLTVAASASDKVYDGGTSATIALGSADVVAGDNISFSGNGSFANKNAGTAKTVNVAGISSSGSDSSNYSIANTSASAQAAITPKPVVVTATAADKTYDGTVAAQVALSASGLLQGDQASFSGTGAFADKNAGAGKAVTVSSITASGADAGNYSYNSSASSQASITQRLLTVTLQGLVSKALDGNADATLASSNYNVGNLVTGDSITLSHTAGQYQDALLGSNKVITTTLADADYTAAAGTALGNYRLVTGAVSGPIGAIVAANAASSSNATVNSAGITGNAGDVSLPLAFNAVVASMPTPATGGDQPAAGTNGSDPIGTVKTTSSETVGASPLAPATATAVSSNTRENLLFRRAFSIGDGGIRLPQGVRGSEKDASQ